MDNRYYESVIGEMKPFLDEQSFVSRSDGSFLSEKNSVKVEYSEDRQMYILSIAEVTDGTVGEYSEISSWLFDDSQNEKDASSVGIDFTDTLRTSLGIKVKRKNISNDIDLPSAQKDGSLNITGFTKKVLDVFPQYKDTYKAHIAKYGNFLYINFYAETLVFQVNYILTENSKKTVKKLFELLESGYLQGDKDTANIVVAVIAAAIIKNDAIKENAFAMLEPNQHFKSSVEAFIPVLSKNKKLSASLIK